MAAGTIIQRLAIILRARGVRTTRAQLRGLGSQANATSAALLKLGGKAGAIMLVVGSLYALVKVFSHALKVGQAFEQAMANLKAVSGATTTELLRLESTARRLGMSTRYSATEVGNLQVEFARLGFTVDEIDKATAGTLALAAAVNADLAQAALIAGQTVRAFQYDAGETTRVTDVMARAFTSTALTIDKFSDSMTYIAPVAKAAGFDIEGTSAALGVVTNAGISGSIAGTSLRRIFVELSDESSKLTKRLGGPIKNSKDLAIALNRLSKEGLTTAKIKKLVGLRATSAFKVLMDGSEDLYALTASYERAGGAAQEMADIQLDTLEGKLIIMKSAWEGFGVAMYEHFDQPLQAGVVAMTDFIQGMNLWMGIPVSEKLEVERQEMDALFGALLRTNLPAKKRGELLDQMNVEYRDYLPNLISEKDSIDDIKLAREEANREFIKSIVLSSQQDRMAAIVKENSSIYNAWGMQIIKVEKAQTAFDSSTSKMSGGLTVLNDMFGSNIDATGMYNQIKEKQNKIDEISSKQMNEFQVRLHSVAGAGNEYINMSEEIRDIERFGVGTKQNMIDAMTEEEKAFVGIYENVDKYKKILEDETLTEKEREIQLNSVNEELRVQQLIIDKITESMNKRKSAADGGLPTPEGPTFFEDFFGIKNLDFEEDFALISSYTNQISGLMESFAQHNIDVARAAAQEKISIIEEEMNAELSVLKKSHRYSKMSDEQKMAAEKQITDAKEALIKAEEEAANEKLKREFKVMQAAKIASIAMSTADAVMKAMAGNPFSAGMPWTALAVAMGAAQTALVLKQKPPVMEEGGLVLGQSHLQGGTMVNAEAGEFVMRKKAVEAIGLDTLNSLNEGMGGQGITINFNGNVMSDDFITDEAIPKIREAIRRGESLE